MKLNRAQRIIVAAERDAILGVCSSYALGGVDRFSRLDIGKLDALLAAGHADPDERQNDAPSTAEFRDFLAAHPRFTAHGYVVSPHRDDCRLSLEGVQLDAKPTQEEIAAFSARFAMADEFVLSDDRLYCWYD